MRKYATASDTKHTTDVEDGKKTDFNDDQLQMWNGQKKFSKMQKRLNQNITSNIGLLALQYTTLSDWHKHISTYNNDNNHFTAHYLGHPHELVPGPS